MNWVAQELYAQTVGCRDAAGSGVSGEPLLRPGFAGAIVNLVRCEMEGRDSTRWILRDFVSQDDVKNNKVCLSG
jgi:hypothetical protein